MDASGGLFASLEARLNGILGEVHGPVSEVARHLVERPGKRLRPTLLFRVAGDRAETDRALDAAAALELVHIASLYHDDIMDRADSRRGASTANARWGNVSAAGAGTCLMSCAVTAAARCGDETARSLLESTALLCRGQLRESENAFNVELAEAEHLEILRLKTAVLFVLAVRLGSEVAELSPTASGTLREYAEDLGLAFQIHDDWLDWVQTSDAMGKGTRADLRSGVYTLPLLRALASGEGGHLRDLLTRRALGEDEFFAVEDLVARSGTLDAVAGMARGFSERAIARLETLPATVDRDGLATLARFAVERGN